MISSDSLKSIVAEVVTSIRNAIDTWEKMQERQMELDRLALRVQVASALAEYSGKKGVPDNADALRVLLTEIGPAWTESDKGEVE